MSINTKDLRVKAFEEFKRIAGAEKRDFTYNIAYRRLVPQFSTAPQAETQTDLKLIEDAARLGHGGLVMELGEDLYQWAHDNGYQHAAP